MRKLPGTLTRLLLCALAALLVLAPVATAAKRQSVGGRAASALRDAERLTPAAASERATLYLAAGLSQDARCARDGVRSAAEEASDLRAASRARTALLGRGVRNEAARLLLASRVGWPLLAYEEGTRSGTRSGVTRPCAVAGQAGRGAFWLRYFSEVQRRAKSKRGVVYLRTQFSTEKPRSGTGVRCVQRTFVAGSPGSADLRADALTPRARWSWHAPQAAGCVRIAVRQLTGGGAAAPGAGPQPTAAVAGGGKTAGTPGSAAPGEPAPGGSAPGDSAPAETPLTWEGRIQSIGSDGKPTSKGAYQSRIALSDADGVIKGTSDYSGAGCAGVLTFVRRQGSRFVFTEKLTSGTEVCVDGGTVTLLVDDAGVEYRWEKAGVSRDRGRLERVR